MEGLSILGWVSGVQCIIIVSFGWIFGLYVIYESKKTNAKLLFYAGLFIISTAMCYFGSFVDFLTILLTGSNSEDKYTIGLMNFVWIMPTYFFGNYVIVSLFHPKKKWYFLSILILLSVIYYIFLFADVSNAISVYEPPSSGEEPYSGSPSKPSSPTTIILLLLNFLLLLNICTFIAKIIKESGVLRKKLTFLCVGITMQGAAGFLYTVLPAGVLVYITSIIMILGFFLVYLGLREESERGKLEGDDILRFSKHQPLGVEGKNSEHSLIRIVCPKCNVSETIKIPKDALHPEKILTVSIPVEEVCEHQFQAFIDGNGDVRGYQLVDFRFFSKKEIKVQGELFRVSKHRLVGEQETLEKVDGNRSLIFVVCPKCNVSETIKIPKDVLNAEKLLTISIPGGVICNHHFQAYLDRNGDVRGYQVVGFIPQHLKR